MSMTIEDLIHTSWTVCKWQISIEDPTSVYNKIVYTGVIDKMPLDVYFQFAACMCRILASGRFRKMKNDCF